MNGMSLRKDVLPVAALTLVGVFISAGGDGQAERWVGALVVPTITGPLLWRRRAPLECTVAVAAGMVLSGFPTFDQTRCAVAVPAAVLALFALSTRGRRRHSAGGAVLLFGGLSFVGVTDPVVAGGMAGFWAVAGVLLLVAWAGGLSMGARQRLVAELAQRSVDLQRRRAQVAALAVDVERTQLVGELDDAARARVRHIVERSTAGRHDLSEAQLRATFAEIERSAREALNGMRSLVGVLGSGEAARPHAQPTLAQLGGMVGAARTDGRTVTLELHGSEELPESLQIATYRVAEHALAAVAADTAVCVRGVGGGVQLDVAGAQRAGGDADEAIAAVRERVRTYGGRLTVEEPAPGRRRLHAWLPASAVRA